MNEKRVLFVDDDQTIGVFISAVLKNAGFEVVTVQDATEALLLIQESCPDLIISDIDMPGMNGWEFLRKVRDHAEASKKPFIFLTGGNHPEDYKRAKAEGVNMVLPKGYGSKFIGLCGTERAPLECLFISASCKVLVC